MSSADFANEWLGLSCAAPMFQSRSGSGQPTPCDSYAWDQRRSSDNGVRTLQLESFPKIHDVADPALFGLLDFKVLLLEKPGGTQKAGFTEQKGYRWYSKR